MGDLKVKEHPVEGFPPKENPCQVKLEKVYIYLITQHTDLKTRTTPKELPGETPKKITQQVMPPNYFHYSAGNQGIKSSIIPSTSMREKASEYSTVTLPRARYKESNYPLLRTK